jgi:tRNA(Arg) A34 adenosine deaminase TadA
MTDGSCRIAVARDRFTFSAAHFARIGEAKTEPLHGHNYEVVVEIVGAVSTLGMVMDFTDLKPLVALITGELNQRTLLPTDADWLHLDVSPDRVLAECFGRRYEFPRDDVTLIPIANSTVECLAAYIADRLAADINLNLTPTLEAVEITVAESSGQRATVARKIATRLVGNSPTGGSQADIEWIRTAITLARSATEAGESPFASVIANGEHELGRGTNETRSSGNATRHAEIVAIEAATREAGGDALATATLYSTCAPCPMCLSAAFYAGIGRVVYGSLLATARQLGSGDPDLSPEKVAEMGRLPVEIIGRVCEDEADELLRSSIERRGEL